MYSPKAYIYLFRTKLCSVKTGWWLARVLRFSRRTLTSSCLPLRWVQYLVSVVGFSTLIHPNCGKKLDISIIRSVLVEIKLQLQLQLQAQLCSVVTVVGKNTPSRTLRKRNYSHSTPPHPIRISKHTQISKQLLRDIPRKALAILSLRFFEDAHTTVLIIAE